LRARTINVDKPLAVNPRKPERERGAEMVVCSIDSKRKRLVEMSINLYIVICTVLNNKQNQVKLSLSLMIKT
jgi:hypothetical protein